MKSGRRLFVGDLHGCGDELDALLNHFAFTPGKDRLFSVGDICGKGPKVEHTLRRLRELDAQIVLGNHDAYVLKAAQKPAPERSDKQKEYLALLGSDADAWIDFIAAWPLYLELSDILLVHAGLEPGPKAPAEMPEAVLLNIRTWDGKGHNLNREGDPPWYECLDEKSAAAHRIVVFGHWAVRGLVDLPRFKGLDTGCVYGGKLTGWCPEEDRFLQIPARRAYAPIHAR